MSATQSIIESIKAAGSQGKTAPELQKELGIPAGTATSRTSTLHGEGKLLINGKRGRAKVYVLNQAPTPPAARLSTKIHYEIVIDNTGSMSGSKEQEAFKLVEAQIGALDQMPSLYTFSEKADLQAARLYGTFGSPLGVTNLFAATIAAVARAQKEPGPRVVLVFTDGIADDTHRAGKLYRTLATAKDTTLAFLIPVFGEGRELLERAGVQSGNIREWGSIEQASKDAVAAAKNFKEAVKRGARSTRTYFAADLSKISGADLNDLTDITAQIRRWETKKETTMQSLLTEKTGSYTPGTGFAEVMKKEPKVAPDRKFLLLNPTTGRVYADGKKTVREYLGYPKTACAIKPGNHAGFVVLYQSKSSVENTFRSRILPRGTHVVLWPNAA